MISRRKFVGFLSAVPLVGKALIPNPQHNTLLPPGHPAPECAEEVWAQFATELAHTLADLDEDEFLIIETKRDEYYVQFAAQGSFGMRAEAVSNGYLDNNEKLSEEACAKLLNLGWNAPTYVPDNFHSERKDPDGSPNYFLDIGVPVPYSAASIMAVHTLCGVFGTMHPGELQYKAFAKCGDGIRFPRLRIARKHGGTATSGKKNAPNSGALGSAPSDSTHESETSEWKREMEELGGVEMDKEIMGIGIIGGLPPQCSLSKAKPTSRKKNGKGLGTSSGKRTNQSR